MRHLVKYFLMATLLLLTSTQVLANDIGIQKLLIGSWVKQGSNSTHWTFSNNGQVTRYATRPSGEVSFTYPYVTYEIEGDKVYVTNTDHLRIFAFKVYFIDDVRMGTEVLVQDDDTGRYHTAFYEYSRE